MWPNGEELGLAFHKINAEYFCKEETEGKRKYRKRKARKGEKEGMIINKYGV
jgi:hypothetical protein